MDDQIYLVIAGTFIGFIALAFGLLYPVYRFITREERAEKSWTRDAIAKRQANTGDSASTGRPPVLGPPAARPPAAGPPAAGPPAGPPDP